MAVLANQRVEIRRPGATTPSYGLFAVTRAAGTFFENLSGPLEMARQGGLVYQTGVCELPTCYETNCISTLGTKNDGEPPTLIEGDPFVILAEMSCGLPGFTQENATRLLGERLRAGEQAAVEATFSTGDCGQAPSLANNTPAAVDAGAGADIVEAVSNLESSLYSVYGPGGVLHVPYAAGAYLMNAHQVWRDSAGIWRTLAGTAVSIGNYAGLGPAGEVPAAGSTYLYATGQVSIWRTPDSEVFETEVDWALDRTTNQVFAKMEREYVVAFECASFYSLTTLVTV